MRDQRSEQQSAARGLATVALLRVNFDAGHDHIGMFVPFVLDAMCVFDADGFDVSDVQQSIRDRSQLSIPAATLKTLLGRIVKQGFARREGGRYFPGAKHADCDDLIVARRAVEERQRGIAASLAEYAESRGTTLATTEDALAAILGFMERHHVALALGDAVEGDGGVDGGEFGGSVGTDLLVAGFLQSQLEAGDGALEVIQEMLEGFVLQNALLLRDISMAARRFSSLEAYLDTGLLLGALGFRGEATEHATKEALSLMREAGAVLAAFDVTVKELRGILSVYETKLGTAEGRLSLYPTDVTRHFLTKRYSPSDVATASALVERNLRSLGIQTRTLPPHHADFTLGEERLGELLADRADGDRDPRVLHDVDCVAAVLTLRAGQTFDSLDNARAVFVTTSRMTVRNTKLWYEEQGGAGVPLIVHHLGMSNLAWLKRPASASDLKLHELVALCAAAVRPTRKAWDSFLEYLRRLQASGELSSDEVTAVIVSALTDRVLAEETADDDTDAASLSEVVERVKSAYREEATEALASAEQAARLALDEAHREKKELQREADRKVAEAEKASLAREEEARALRMSVEGRVRQLARWLCWLPTVLLGACLGGGLVVTIVGMQSGEPLSTAGWLLASGLVIVGFLSVLWGFNLKGWRLSLEERCIQRLKGWMSGGST